MVQQSRTTEVFCCYARKDTELLRELKTHLISLQRQDVIQVWHDGDISAGKEWDQEIKEHLNGAEIILLLISADFIESDYCYSTEMQHALERHKQGDARVIPVLLRPTHGWEKVPPGDIQLSQLQALPKDARPVTSWTDHDEAWKEVVEGIERVVSELLRKSLMASSTLPFHAHTPSGSSPRIGGSVTPIKPQRRIPRRAILIGGTALGLGFAVGGVTLLTKISSIAVGTQLNSFEATGAIRALAWSRDGRFIAAANDLGTVPVWDVNANKLIHTCVGHSDHVEGISWSPNGKYMVSGSADGTARIWNVEAWEIRYIYTGHTVVDAGTHRPWVNRVQWSPDGTRIVSCDQTSSNNTATVQVWDAETGNTLVTYSEHINGVYSVAWSPNNKSIASVGYDGVLRVWEAASGKTLVTIPGSSPRWLFGAAWSPDGKHVAFGGTDYIVWVTSLDGQQKAALYLLPGSGGWGIRDIVWSPQGKYIAVSTRDLGVHIIRSDTGTLVYAKTDTLVGDISALGWSPTDTRIASGNGFSTPSVVQIWQAPIE